MTSDQREVVFPATGDRPGRRQVDDRLTRDVSKGSIDDWKPVWGIVKYPWLKREEEEEEPQGALLAGELEKSERKGEREQNAGMVMVG